MGAYYYFAAQLPYLIYDQKPPMSSSAFKALAETQLTDEDAKLMTHLSLDPDPENAKSDSPSYAEAAPLTGCEFIDNWCEWERSLRLNLAKSRAVKMRRDNVSAAEPPVYPQEAVAAAHKALAGELSPLEGEILIDKARWSAIDGFAGIDYFDRNTIYAYYLKLLLLERKMSFNVEKGFAEYKSLYASIIESAKLELK